MSGGKAADEEWTDGVTEPSARPTERHLSRARGYRYIDAPSPTLTEAHEEVFLNMRLRSLRKLEEAEIKTEHTELTAEKKELNRLLKSKELPQS